MSFVCVVRSEYTVSGLVGSIFSRYIFSEAELFWGSLLIEVTALPTQFKCESLHTNVGTVP